eukprot:11443701-Karenia_brevis.AAC.1
MLLAISNGQACIVEWAPDYGADVCLDLKRRSDDMDGRALIDEWAVECAAMHEHSGAMRPDVLEYMTTVANKPMPLVSTTCALDAHDESVGGLQLCSLAMHVEGVPVSSREHDGENIWTERATDL